jgi:hypothetical protein
MSMPDEQDLCHIRTGLQEKRLDKLCAGLWSPG